MFFNDNKSKKKASWLDIDLSDNFGSSKTSVGREIDRKEYLKKATNSNYGFFDRQDAAKKAGHAGIMGMCDAEQEASRLGINIDKNHARKDDNSSSYLFKAASTAALIASVEDINEAYLDYESIPKETSDTLKLKHGSKETKVASLGAFSDPLNLLDE